MGDLTRLLPTVAAAALLAFGATACGGDDSTTTPTQPAAGAARPDRPPAESSDGIASDGTAKKDGASSGDGERDETGGSGESDFVPKEHDDSGGGSAQLRIEGGDNSVQEFGEEASDSEREEAATALHNFLDARAAEDWDSACSFLAEDVRESMEKLAAQTKQAGDMSCAGIMEKLTNPDALPALRSEAARADVGSLRIEGDRAFIIYRGPGGAILTFPMTDEGGSWKVASLGGTPLN